MQSTPQVARPHSSHPHPHPPSAPLVRAVHGRPTSHAMPGVAASDEGDRHGLSGLLALLVILWGLCTGQAMAATHTVTSNADSGPGSLRQAIADAAAGDTITFDMTQVASPITLGGTELLIDKTLTINGPGADKLAISGNNASRVFNIATGATLAINGVTVTKGKAEGEEFPQASGGGILIGTEATLNISNCIVAENAASDSGGGIYNSEGTLTVLRSSFNRNSATIAGGIDNMAGTATITDTTFFGNSTRYEGAGIYNEFGTLTVASSTFSSNSSGSATGGGIMVASGTVTITSSTFSGNWADYSGGGIHNFEGSVTVKNTLVAGNTSGVEDPEIAGSLEPASTANLIGIPDGKEIGDVLLPLADNGGLTQTHALAPNSPAIDAGDNAAAAGLAFDQRGNGFPRQLGARVDIGAVEGGPCQAPITVTNAADSGPGSLRKALADICPGGTIKFAAEMAGQTIILSGELLIDRNVTIQGPGADKLTISGNDATRVFDIPVGIVVIDGVTVTKGSNALFGGGILNGGTLTVSNSTISGNRAVSYGGGICNVGNLTVSNSTISGNSEGLVGGGIYNEGTLTVSNSTISGNSSPSGGGIMNNVGGTATLSSSTICDNSGNGAGGIFNQGTLTAKNTLVVGNTAPADPEIYGLLAPGSVNNITQLPAGKTISDILLPLSNNGGPTQTHALAANSPAIDAGDNASATGLEFDQRGEGYPRQFGAKVDIGAFEVQNTVPSITCFETATIGCALASGKSVTLKVRVSDPDTGSLTVTLLEGATPLDTKSVAGPASNQEVSFTVTLAPGAHALTARVSDGVAEAENCGPVTVTVVEDKTGPSLTCPGNVTVNATSPSGAVASYGAASASDACDGTVTLDYSKASGTLFAIGLTTVTVTATDANGNQSTCTFTVKVKSAAEQIQDLIAQVNRLPNVRSPNKQALVTKLQAALTALASGNTAGACQALRDFLNIVKAQADKKLISAAQAAALMAEAVRIRAVIGCP